MKLATVDVARTAKSITININMVGMKRFKVRLFFAKMFFWIGTKVAGTGIKFIDTEATKDHG